MICSSALVAIQGFSRHCHGGGLAGRTDGLLVGVFQDCLSDGYIRRSSPDRGERKLHQRSRSVDAVRSGRSGQIDYRAAGIGSNVEDWRILAGLLHKLAVEGLIQSRGSRMRL